MTLRDALDRASGGIPDALETVDGNGATTWAIHEVVFATLDGTGTTASFRLDPILAGAARRTPDTTDSFLGHEWVEFRPALVDGHAVDRATSWFEAAARRAVRA